jgi:uncharacterized membrane protein YfcA
MSRLLDATSRLGCHRRLEPTMFDTGEIILLIVSFATAMLSAILGMGGGMLLLAVMLGFMPHAVAIPTHASVQLASNSTRLLIFLKHMDRGALIRFAAGAVAGTLIGAAILILLGELNTGEPYLKCGVGFYVLAASFIPRRKVAAAPRESTRDFVGLGALAGAAGPTIGAVGPLIAPIFARHDYVKERLIATKAACQMFCHVMKIAVFVSLGTLRITKHGPLLVAMIALVIPGTVAGKRLLRYVSPRAFRILYRAALLIAGGKVLIFDGLRPLLFPS